MTAAIVFDLDGTLVDSLADIAAAANRMLADQGHAPLPEETIQGFVGNGLPKLVERVILHCGLNIERHSELTQVTLNQYSQASSAMTRPYPGVKDALQRLRAADIALGVCTNKPEAPARHILEVLDLAQFFDVVIGGDTLKSRKPDPAHLSATFEALGTNDARVFVGDSEVDAETAQRAQVPFLLYSEGYRKSPVSELPHLASFDDFARLPDLALGIIGLSGTGL
ncbi:phosphoglycolate phosphatase [Ruegeria arenilitoris]|uniref:phosphoglycolate phosphatase n=1 Tax=Ruegeria arenilitoris TaxID=1173585 RepID=UPI00147F344C|nr:phosphoglycolate phosphatase [Ruegeria arenilitoris]